MVVKFEKRELKLEEIHKEGISKENFVHHEQVVIDLIQRWQAGEPSFMFQTSGSTGVAKTQEITRDKIIYSSKATFERIDPDNKFKSAFLCLNPEMIGGAMVVFRSLIHDLDLKVVSPTSDPFKELAPGETYDLTSVVPMQIRNASNEQLNHFHTILVGGANIPVMPSASDSLLYSTFGMTETVSHFALRRQDEESFTCTGDTEVGQTADGRLKIKGTITDNNWLISNDLIELISSIKFKWLGRSDFIINSGGVKINPERVEQLLADQISCNFIMSSLPDEELGNKAILLIEGSFVEQAFDFSSLQKYERPKEVHFLKTFDFTPSGKIDRIKTVRRLISAL